MDAPTDCPGCAPNGLSRRGFVAGAAVGAAATALTFGPLGTRLAFGAPAANVGVGDVLVVVNLRGGFDGLSAVVPHGDPQYLRARPGIGLRANQLLAKDSMFGLHPAMAPLLPLWEAGTFGAVHAVGQIDGSRSHFQATDALERCAGLGTRRGWIDRTLSRRRSTGVFQAAAVGQGTAPPSMAGPMPEVAMGSLADFEINTIDNDATPTQMNAQLARRARAVRAMHKGAPPTLQSPTNAAFSALSRVMPLRSGAPENQDDPELRRALRDVATLIRARVGLQIAVVDLDDWDHHENVGPRFTELAGELATSLRGFADDLGPHLANVTVITMSEFGRRVEQNGSAGVDHGFGNAVLLMGGGVRGGRVHTRNWPGLAPARLDQGDLRGTVDYRQLLWEILAKRCHHPSGDLSTVFPGFRPGNPLGIVNAR